MATGGVRVSGRPVSGELARTVLPELAHLSRLARARCGRAAASGRLATDPEAGRYSCISGLAVEAPRIPGSASQRRELGHLPITQVDSAVSTSCTRLTREVEREPPAANDGARRHAGRNLASRHHVVCQALVSSCGWVTAPLHCWKRSSCQRTPSLLLCDGACK